MGSRSYSVVINSVDAIKFLNAVGKHEDSSIPGYGIRNFIRITSDIKSKRKKSKDLKTGDILANISVLSEDPWTDYPNTYSELMDLEFNIWRLEWFKTTKSKLGGQEIIFAEYLEIPNESLLKNEDSIDGISKKWIEGLIPS